MPPTVQPQKSNGRPKAKKPPSREASATMGMGAAGTDGLKRELHYDVENFPRMRSKFADVVALDSGDSSYLDLEFDAETQAKLDAMKDREHWGAVSLVFGGTGFVGCHLIHELLRDKRTERVYAIVRNRDGVMPEERIFKQWRAFELDENEVDKSKLTVLTGTLADKDFLLPQDQFRTLADKVDTVFQVAGDTDYTPGYIETRQEWVLGMLGIIQFCFDGQAKQMCFVGSTIVSLYTQPEDFRTKDTWWRSGYAQMKWVNQNLVSGLYERGMRAQVIEAPYVLGSTTKGRDPGYHYTFWRVIAIGKALKLAPEGEMPAISPVDLLVDAMILNAFAKDPLPLIRPIYPRHTMVEELAELLGCRVVGYEEGMDKLTNYATPSQLRMFPPDGLKMIASGNKQWIYPPGFDMSKIPPFFELAKFYLEKMKLL